MSGYGELAVVERVGTSLVSIAVWGTAHFDGGRISGALAGDFTTSTTRFSGCQAPDHLVELVRQ